MKDNLQRVYATLKNEGYDLPEYDVFANDMRDDDNLSEVRESLVRAGYTPPEFNVFKVDMFGEPVKEQEQPKGGENGFTLTAEELELEEEAVEEPKKEEPEKVSSQKPVQTKKNTSGGVSGLVRMQAPGQKPVPGSYKMEQQYNPTVNIPKAEEEPSADAMARQQNLLSKQYQQGMTTGAAFDRQTNQYRNMASVFDRSKSAQIFGERPKYDENFIGTEKHEYGSADVLELKAAEKRIDKQVEEGQITEKEAEAKKEKERVMFNNAQKSAAGEGKKDMGNKYEEARAVQDEQHRMALQEFDDKLQNTEYILFPGQSKEDVAPIPKEFRYDYDFKKEFGYFPQGTDTEFWGFLKTKTGKKYQEEMLGVVLNDTELEKLREEATRLGFGGSLAQNFKKLGYDIQDFEVELLNIAANISGSEEAKKKVQERRDAINYKRDSLKPTAEGLGGFVAEQVPQMAGIGLGLIVSLFNPGLGAAIITGSTGVQIASSMGAEANEARRAGASDGQTAVAMLLNGGVELLAEKIPTSTYIKRVLPSFGKFMAETSGEVVDKEFNELLDAAREKMGKKFTAQTAKDFINDVLKEGGSEFAAESLQTLIPMIYQNPEDYPTLKQILENGWEGFKGGTFMGAILGPSSSMLQRRANNKRRAAQGHVDIAVATIDGKDTVVEITGKKDKDTYVALVGDSFIPVKKEDIKAVKSYSYGDYKRQEVEASREEGYNTDPDTVNGSTIALANKSLDDAETAVRVALVLQNDTSIEDFVGGRSVDEVAMGDEAVADALYTYLEEKARYDGMSERLNAERESEIIEADNSVDAVTHEDGNVYMTTLPSTGEVIYITGGTVVLDNDGYIDVNQSEGLVALMPNGKKEAIQAGNIREKVAVENAEAQKAAKRAEIDARYESQLNTFVYSDSEGDHTVMLVGRRGDMVDALIDGRPTEVPAKEFEAIMADATGKQPVVEGGEVKAEGATSGDVVSPVEATQPIEQPGLSNGLSNETAQIETAQPAPKTALEQIPKNENNIPLYEQVDSELAWDGVVEEAGGNEEIAMVAVNSMIADKQDALKKAEKAKARAGATITEKIAAENERIANIEKAKADLAKWEEIAGVKVKRAAAQAENVAQPVAETVPVVESTPVAEVETPQATNEMQPVEESTLSQTSDQVGEQVAEGGNAPGQSGVQEIQEPRVDGKAKASHPVADEVLAAAKEKQQARFADHAKVIAEKLGVEVTVHNDVSTVANREAMKAIAEGGVLKGWYNPNTGEIALYMPNMESMRDVESTILHEAVAHYGIKHLLGREQFNEFLDGVWEMMPAALRAHFLQYVGADMANPSTEKMRQAADEYVAHIAEKMDLDKVEKSIWNKLIDAVFNALRKVGFKNLTRRDIETVIRASYKNLRQNGGNSQVTGQGETMASKKVSENTDSKVIFETAKDIFGITYDMREAGYILPDGTMLDFSGKHQVRSTDNSFLNGRRTVDHREIENIAFDFDENPTGVSTDMADFLDRGAIRIDYSSGNINLNTAPTAKQKALLKRLIERNGGDVYVDFGKGWDTEHYAEYESARASRVLGDIDRYYNEGIKPINEHRTMFRISKTPAEFDAMMDLAVDNKGYVFPDLATTLFPIVEIDYHSFTGKTPFETTENARKFAKSLKGPQKGKIDGYDVELYFSTDAVDKLVSDKGIKKSQDIGGFKGGHLAVVENIFKVLEGSRDVEIHPNVKKLNERREWDNGLDKSVLCHRYYSAVSVAGDEYRVMIMVKESRPTEAEHKITPYTVEVQAFKIEKTNLSDVPEGRANRTTQGEMASDRFTDGAKLLEGVEKSYDKGKFVLGESEKSSAEEENRIRFRKANENQEIFVSNARKAVEEIKQEKATPQQWLAMIKKNGGLKAGEDKWMGLSEWLEEKGKLKGENGKDISLTKQEVLDFVNENAIKIEEVRYSQFGSGMMNEASKKLEAETKEIGWDAMQEKYPGIEDFFEYYNGEVLWSESTVSEGEYEDFILDNKIVDANPADNAINEHRESYTTEGLERKREIALVVPTIEPYNQSDEIHFGDAGEGRAVAWVRFGETTDSEGNRVLVIDEIQSKRHQDGREKGYRSNADKFLKDNGIEVVETDTHIEFYKNGEIDKRFAKALFNTDIEKAKNLYVAGYEKTAVPSAPFEKNWHELAMKRMLRLAAEEGFDKVAWTTGEQQAERYNLGKAFNDIEREDNPSVEGRRFVLNGANVETFQVDENGNIVDSTLAEAKGKPLADVVGKDMAVKMMSLENGDMLEGEDLRIGGEGMKGFYDKMLPSFVSKYTKKWGAKVGTVEMPSLEQNNVMHSVDVTPEMQESVMEGQTMFRFIGKKGAENLDKAEEATTRLDNLNVAREMETAGKDAKAIKLATGWERGADGKWRYETEDVKLNRAAELFSLENHESYPIAESLDKGRVDFNGTIKLADLVNDEELFKAYPGMEQYFVSFEEMSANVKGEHDAENTMIRINKDDISELESTLVHEIQHAIQSIEGFAKGSSPGQFRNIDFYDIPSASIHDMYNIRRNADELIENGKYKYLRNAIKNVFNEYRQRGWLSPKTIESFELNVEGEDWGVEAFVSTTMSYSADELNDYSINEDWRNKDMYMRTAGEVESRNVQNRMGMSPEERRNKLAEETEDVRREDQIFLEDALKSAMMGSRVDARMAEVASHFDGKELSAEQRAVADVFGGKADNLTISVKTQDGNTRNVEMRQGNDLAGAKHSLYAHYGTTKGVINADDLLLIPDVIANGERTENGKKAVYKLDVNGTKYTVVTYVKQNKEEFHNFYSNKKGQPSQSVNASIGDTHSARITEELASADKGSTNSAEMQEGETLFSKKELTPEQKKKQEALKENAKAIRRLHNVTSRYPITALRNLGFALETQEQREMHDRLFAERDAITGESMPAGLQTNPQAMTLQERITESLLKHAEQEKENVEMRLSAIRAYGRDLANVIKLMNAQKGYDKRTVRIFTDLVKMYLRNNAMSGMSSYKIIRLLNLMQKATGGHAKTVNRAAVKIAEIITNEHTSQLEAIMEKQMKTGAERVNASGVVVQGGVDIIGKRILNTYKDAINLDDEGFEEKYNDSFKRVGEIQKQLEENGSNTALENQLEEAQAEADAMLLAATYRNEVKAAEADITKIKDELTGKRTKAEKGEITWKEYHEFAKTINSQIVQLRAQQIDAYQKVLHALSGDIYEGVQRARAFREAEAMRVQRIHDMAESDMNGVDKSAERKEPGAAGKTVDMVVYKNPIVRTVMNGLGTYENYMKYFGRDHLDGRGELFNHFMTAFTEAQNKEWKESQNDFNILEAAAQEIFGKKRIGKTYKSIARESTKPSGVILKYWNGGATVERELTIGQLMYLYMTEKQAEGQMKLRNMGLTEEKVQGAVEQLPTKYKKFADYIQAEFLPQMRPRMNEVHQRMFGASMSEVENYFPLKVNMGARQGNDDLNNTADTIPSTITGSVIKRRVNVTPIDLMANAFDVLNEHIVDMEHWAAYAEFIRDNNTLINDKDFKNRVQNTKSVRYGDGETLWKNFVDTARIATGNYKSKADYLAKLMSGANAAKITFGYYTALKQLASMPAFWSDAKIWDAVWYSVNPMGSWRWAKENLPGFEERWKGRTAGNERLGENEYSIHDSRIMKAARMVGMTPNAFVDAVVVASGARAVYKDRLNFYKKLGMTEYEADRRAKNDAAISYNETQQSGQGAYLSTLQKDGGLVALLTTLFRNSQMAFQRRVVGSMVEVGKKLARGEKIREATKQKYIKMGMSEEAAGKQANRDFCKAYAKDITNLAIFGYAMNYVWALMGELPYLLFGDDDEEKEKIFDTAAKMGITGTFEGFTCGNFAKSLYEKHITDGKYAVGLLEAPFEGDLQVVFERFEKDGTIAGVLQLAMFATEMNTGISPQRLIDTVTAFIYYSNGDIDKATRAQLFALRLLKAPQSQQDKLILDETDGADVEEVKSIAEWYIKYKMARNFPLGSEDEKRVDKYANKFVETLKERVEKEYSPEDISVIFDQSSDTEKEILKKKWIEGMDERNGTNVAKSLRKEKLEELLGSPVENAATKALHKYSKVNTYEKLETFEDLERWYEYKVLHDKFKSDYEKIRDGEELSPEERAKAVEHYGVYADKGFKEVINAIGAHKKFIKQNKDPEWRMSEVRRLTDIATEIMKRYE